MKNKKGNIEIKFKLDEVANQFLFHLKEIIDCVNQIYYAVEETSIQNKPLPTDSLPIYIDDKRPRPKANEQKEKTINWLLKKAFEEFIAGLTKSLIEAYCFVKFQKLSSVKFLGTKAELEEKIEKIRINANKAHFPELIEHIEKELGNSLYLKDEIQSINRIRNCMVHRDSVVQQKDLMGTDMETLNLKWISLNYYTIQNGERIALDYKSRVNRIRVKKMEIEKVHKIKKFKLKDRILIDLNEFNGISYTCSEFVNTLLRSILITY